jgi:hypothetical protein
MRKINRPVTVGAGLVAAIAIVAVSASAVGATASGTKTSGKFYLGITPQAKSGIQYIAGQGTDKALGSDAITFTIKPLPKSSGVLTAKAIKVTLWASGGTLTGTGSATVTITNSPKPGDATVSGGTVSLTKGTGALKGHSFKAKFSGNGNIVSALYVFTYSGTYK